MVAAFPEFRALLIIIIIIIITIIIYLVCRNWADTRWRQYVTLTLNITLTLSKTITAM